MKFKITYIQQLFNEVNNQSKHDINYITLTYVALYYMIP